MNSCCCCHCRHDPPHSHHRRRCYCRRCSCCARFGRLHGHQSGRRPLAAESPACRSPPAPKPPPPTHTVTMRALRHLPRVRGLSLRWVAGSGGAPGVYRGVRLEARAPNAEAALAQGRGAVALRPCESCVRGGGPFTECVLVAGQLRGSCANCHYYGSEGAAPSGPVS
jgi:hypothetical protein